MRRTPESRSTADREPADSARPGSWTRELAIDGAIAAVALVVRIVYLWQIRSAPVANRLMGDGKTYVEWARDIAAGNWIGNDVFYQAPLYPYFLALVFVAFGPELLAVRGIQAVLGAVSCVVLRRAGQRLFSPAVGVVAGLTLALYPSAIYFDGLIQKSVLDMLFVSLLLLAIARAQDRPGLARWLIVGAVLGAFALTRENALFLVPIACAGAFIVREAATTWRSRGARAGAVLAGLVVVLLPVAARNRIAGGEWHPTTSQLGTNLFIGNNPAATGVYRPLKPGRGNPIFEREDATALAERDVGAELTPEEVSRYWSGRAIGFVREQPAAWFRLMVRKWLLLWNDVEIGDTEDQYTHADASSLLRILGVVLRFGTLVPLAVFGLVLSWPERRRLAVMLLMFGGYALSVLLFYVFARYRYPLVAFLVLLSAAGIVGAPIAFRQGRRVALALGLVLAVATAWMVTRPVFPRNVVPAMTWQNLALLAREAGDAGEAEAACRAALRHEPGFVEARVLLGDILRDGGRLDEARVEYAEAARLEPGSVEARIGLALVAVARPGSGAGAVAADTSRQGGRSAQADALFGMAQADVAAGRIGEAIAHFDQALRDAPSWPEAENNLAFLLATVPDPGLRDGGRALSLALSACEATAHRDPGMLDTLAVALGGTGRFAAATTIARAAAAEARSRGWQDLAQAINAHADLLASGITVR